MSKKSIVPVACCISLLAGCASNQAADTAPWAIRPTENVRGTGATAAAMYQLGRYYQGQNRFDLAVDAYQKSLAADAGYVEARNALGVVYSRQGKYAEAIEAFTAALDQAPDATHIRNNLGYAYYLDGQYSAAVMTLEQAVAQDPANRKALNNLGLAYAKAGEMGKAEQAHEKAESVASAEMAQTSAPVMRESRKPAIVPAEVMPVKVVQLSPSVYELRDLRKEAPAPVHATADIPSPEKIKVEVSNGNGVTGMAKRVGRYLRGSGYPQARLTNQKSFRVQTTLVQYRDGYEAAAKRLRDSLPVNATLEHTNDLRADIKIRIVLGKDIAGHWDYFATPKKN